MEIRSLTLKDIERNGGSGDMDESGKVLKIGIVGGDDLTREVLQGHTGH